MRKFIHKIKPRQPVCDVQGKFVVFTRVNLFVLVSMLCSFIWDGISKFIKCLSNCARYDWSVRVHYSSIKHAADVTRVLYRVIMLAAYVMSLSALFP